MNWVLIVAIIIGIVYYVNKIKGSSSTAQSSSYTSSTDSSSSTKKPVQPYPMKSGAINAAIGAVDRCCEFAAFCEKYVIPAGVCSPEKLDGYIMASPHAISFGFNWKTFYYTLDSLIEEQGYSIQGGGFGFSDNSGMVSYQRQILSNEEEYAAAYLYLMNTPVGEITANFERIAEKNFTSLGINNHSASCRCTRSESDTRSFTFTV